MSTENGGMTKTERKELAKLARKRARVEKSLADQRKAELLADFEDALHRRYSWDEDEVWEEATKRAEEAVAEAKEEIARRCAELGIPRQFAPGLRLGWYGRGRNATKDERTEMRRQAKLRLEAMAKAAKVEIDRACVETEERLIAGGLETAEAKAFLEDMPRIRDLIPDLADNEVRELLPGGTAGPSCANCGKLMPASRSDAKYCSDACKQRAYRKRVTAGNGGAADSRNGGAT